MKNVFLFAQAVLFTFAYSRIGKLNQRRYKLIP